MFARESVKRFEALKDTGLVVAVEHAERFAEESFGEALEGGAEVHDGVFRDLPYPVFAKELADSERADDSQRGPSRPKWNRVRSARSNPSRTASRRKSSTSR